MTIKELYDFLTTLLEEDPRLAAAPLQVWVGSTETLTEVTSLTFSGDNDDEGQPPTFSINI